MLRLLLSIYHPRNGYLLNLAGQDVTDAFIAYHPGTAWALLDHFYIGYLADHRISAISKDYRRLVAEFARLGLFDKKGHGVLCSLTFMVFLLVASVSGVLFSTSVLVHLISASLTGLLWIQSGFLGHDSGHYNDMISPGFNRLMQILSGNCLTGISVGWWKRNHNSHHIACNSLDFDLDVQHIPLSAASKDQSRAEPILRPSQLACVNPGTACMSSHHAALNPKPRLAPLGFE